MDQPHQIAYEFVCQQVGKMYIESQHELTRLTEMLIEIQKKFSTENQEHLKTKSELQEAKKKIALLEVRNGTSSEGAFSG